jgi:hypothetical protein
MSSEIPRYASYDALTLSKVGRKITIWMITFTKFNLRTLSTVSERSLIDHCVDSRKADQLNTMA